MVPVAKSTALYMCRTLPRRSPLHRRFQIALVLYRKRKRIDWKSHAARALVAKYNAGVDQC